MGDIKKYIVILSGWASDRRFLEQLIKLLEKHYNVTLVEYNDITSLDDIYLKSKKAIMNKDQVHLIGWSLGSTIACRLAAEFDNIKDLTLIGGFAKFICSKDHRYGVKKSIVKSMINGLRDEPINLINSFYKNCGMSVKRELIQDWIKDKSVESLILGLEYLINIDVREYLRSISTRVKIIHSMDDGIVQFNSSKYLKDSIPESKIYIIEDGGHAPMNLYSGYIVNIIENAEVEKET